MGSAIMDMIHTSVACNAASFFRSSEPRFTMARVVSVRSCLVRHVNTGNCSMFDILTTTS